MIRSLIFTTIMFVTVPPWAVGVILVRPFGRGASYAVAVSWVRMVLWCCRMICGLDMEIEGQENLPDRNGVVFMKHSSAYETLAQFSVVPGEQTWVIKRELTWAPFFRLGDQLRAPNRDQPQRRAFFRGTGHRTGRAETCVMASGS